MSTGRPAVQPWATKTRALRPQIFVAAVVPVAVSLLVMMLTGTDFSIALLGVFLPLQLAAAAFVGFKNFKFRGVKDAALMVFVYFFSALVFVLLLSVLFSVITKGFEAMSPQFIYQNNRYVSNVTSLEYGGVGHAILGTLLIVLLTTIVAVPLGIAMGVYLTSRRRSTWASCAPSPRRFLVCHL